MKISPEELAARYRAMSDDELVGLDRAELTDTARQCYDREIERRKLESRPDAEPEPGDAEPVGGRWICAGLFRTEEEAEAVREVLESAGVAARLAEGDVLWLGGSSYPGTRVMVPHVMENNALGLIESHGAEQEFAARAAAEPAPVSILARYEDGVFKPVDPVELEEGMEVEVRLPPAQRAHPI